jgi:hypothetical protein
VAMQPSRLNALYGNSAYAQSVQGAWTYKIYSDADGAALKSAIIKALRYENIWQEDVTSQLRLLLQVSLSYARALVVVEPGITFWDDHTRRLEICLKETSNYLPSELRNYISDAIELQRKFSLDITTRLVKSIFEAIGSVPGKILVVPETKTLGEYFANWVNHNSLNERVTVLLEKGKIHSQLFENFEMVLIPGSPIRFSRRKNFDIYLRALLFAGISPKAYFVSPDWASFSNEEKFAQSLFFGLEVDDAPTIQILRDEAALVSIEDIDQMLEIEQFETTHQSGDYEELETGGTTPCRLVRIGANLAYPVESDSKKISTFSFDESKAEWALTYKQPFEDLEIGNIVVACVGSSETQSLRDRAAEEMGRDFSDFMDSQITWKSRLDKAFVEFGIDGFEGRLRNAGVKRWARARYWVLPDAIQPGLAMDFEITLKILGYSNSQVRSTVDLASSYDGQLIKAGRQAGQAITKSLDEDDLAKLEAGVPFEISLEDFGDATYLLSPVTEIEGEEIMCRSSQIRKVITVPERNDS